MCYFTLFHQEYQEYMNKFVNHNLKQKHLKFHVYWLIKRLIFFHLPDQLQAQLVMGNYKKKNIE